MSCTRKFSPYSTLMEFRKASHKTLNYRKLTRLAKSPIFSVVAFATIFFLIYADSLISNLSVYPADIRITDIFERQQSPDKDFETLQTPKIEAEVESTSNTMPQPTRQEKIEEDGRPLVITQERVEENNSPLFIPQQRVEGNSLPVIVPQQKVEENSLPLIMPQQKVEENSRSAFTMQQRVEENSNPMLIAGQGMNEDEEQDLLVSPKVTREERIDWFRSIVPELEILHSNELTQKFHGRVLEFFNRQCSIQFFMIWLSPARSFGPREFLAADTLLKANPQACLMIISRSLDTERGYGILKPLLDRGFKVLAITPDLPFLVKGTPAETWLEEMKSGNKDPGNMPLSNNFSNLIRLAMLYKYGGIYLDTDFIVLKDFTGLRNALGAQSIDQVTKKWSRLNNAVLVFDIGHPVLVDFLQEFAMTFDGTKWGYNGPYLVSRVMERLGETSGYDLTVLSPRAFYPVDWNKIVRLFKKPETEEDSKWIDEMTLQLSSNSYAMHLWNKKTRDLVIEEGSVMDKIIAGHCAVCQNNYNS